ncbi:MAG: GHKL domain-containing protein [Candidatus Omnitrophica bacterium]|nr:GHKL domain-containing protein [Candidatus Omnitrophota bacterium]
MSRKAPFLNKLLARLDKIDRDALQSHIRSLAREHDLLFEALESMPAGAALLRQDRTVMMLNPAARVYLGYEDETVPADIELSELAQDTALKALFHEYPSSSEPRHADDVRVLLPREMTLRIQFLPLERFAPGAWFVLMQDVSAAGGRDVTAGLWSSRESLLQLAAGVAHEIGNPLNAIQIHLNLLKREAGDLPPARQKNFLKTLTVLQSETSRLDRIVRAFLKATRKPPLRFKPTDLNAVIQESADFFQPELEGRKVSIHFRPDKSLRPFLMDRERLKEVFLNLIKNAMEAMPDGGDIRISVTHKQKAAWIRVRDEGPGIPDEVLPHIFEAYYTTKPEGSGLGLVSVYNAVAEHGGRIEVETRKDKGTTFTLMMPIREPRLQISSESSSDHGRREDRSIERG